MASYPRVGRHERRGCVEYRGIGDRTQCDIAHVLQRPAGVVIRRRVVRAVVLLTEVALRERAVGLVERNDVVTRRDVDPTSRERLVRAPYLDAMEPEQVDEIRRLDRPRLVRRNLKRVRPLLRAAMLDRAHSFAIELVQIPMPSARHVVQRDEQGGLLVIDVVADTPPHAVQRGIRPEPFDRRLTVRKLYRMAVGSARRVRLVEAPDRVVAVRDPEHVVRRPPVIEIMRPDAGQTPTRERRDFLEGELVPLADHDGIQLAVVRSRARRRIEERHRLVQVVQHGGMPREERLHHGPGQHLRHHDAVPVVIVRRVLPPVDQTRPDVLVRLAVAIGVDHAVAPIDFRHWRDECYDAVANLPDEWRLFDRQPVRQFHEHLWRSGFG